MRHQKAPKKREIPSRNSTKSTREKNHRTSFAGTKKGHRTSYRSFTANNIGVKRRSLTNRGGARVCTHTRAENPNFTTKAARRGFSGKSSKSTFRGEGKDRLYYDYCCRYRAAGELRLSCDTMWMPYSFLWEAA